MTDQLTLEQSLKEIFPTLPRPVQRFIKEGKTGEAAQTIMDKYVLRVDQGGIIEHQILLSLFGVISPEEFIGALTEQLSVSDQTVEDILEDINKEVFVPLREEMRKGGSDQQQKVPAPTPKVTVPSYFPVPPPAGYQKPPAPSTVPSAANPVPAPVRPPAHIAPLPPKLVMPTAPAPKVNTQRSILIETLKAHDINLLEDHEEPHIEFTQKIPAQPQAIPATLPPVAPKVNQAPSKNILFQDSPTASFPHRSPTAGLPIRTIRSAQFPEQTAFPRAERPQPNPPVFPPKESLTPPKVSPPPPPPAPYTVDPYHEPIE